MKRITTIALYTLAALAISFGVSQLAGSSVSAEAGTCCTTSADCPGSQLCYAPSGGLADCCVLGNGGCLGKNYCSNPHGE
jgi:hypothetical protein